jgi:hypothetical protein
MRKLLCLLGIVLAVGAFAQNYVDITIGGNTNRQAKVHKKTAVDNPLLKVPPASRGNQDPSVPLAKRGEP